MGYALGSEGIRWAREIQQGRHRPPYIELPLNDRLLDLSLGIIVHSQWGHQRVLRRTPMLPSVVIPAPIAPYPTSTDRRRDLGWPAEAVIFACLGQVRPAKYVDHALQAFAHLRRNVPQSFFLIVGEWSSEEIDLPAVVGRLGLEEAVHCTGYVEDMPEFVSWIATADVVVNLRNPTVGETSATALRALAAGRPLIVFDHGWYAELPDDACLKVAPDDQEGLVAAMSRLATDESRRQEMGRRAGIYATEVHAPARAAAAYIDFIASVLTGVECGPSRPLD
jgi:glycosyltransferase involved in cell wall biosynthesis